MVTSFDPADDSTGVADGAVFVATFNRAVVVGSGTWELRTGGITQHTMTEANYVAGGGTPSANQWTISGNTAKLR